MSANKKIRAAIVRQTGTPWVIEDVELAPPRSDEVLVRMVGTGICHTDTACRNGFPVQMPIVLGHEGAGVVEAIGGQVSSVKVGDHVVMSFDSCGHCHNCEKDAPAYCFDFFARNFSGRRSDGSSPLFQKGEPLNGVFFSQSSFATYAIAREANAVVVDKDLPLEILGPLGCGVQTGAGVAVNSLNMDSGDSLAIFGGGAVGLSALLGARAIDAGCVIVIEPNAVRRALALELGATHVVDPMANPDVLARIRELVGGVNYAFDTTGIPAVMKIGFESLLPGGCIAMVGAPPPEADFPANLMSMLMRGVGAKYVIEGDSNPKEFIPLMLDWYRAGKFPFDRLIKTFPFEQINEAAHAAETGKVIKPVLVFED